MTEHGQVRGERRRPFALFSVSKMKPWSLLILLALIASAGCSQAPAPTSTPPPTVDPFFAANGAGEPRSASYWQLWNSCAPDNRAQTAAANGGREAGWILMDDLLQSPGVMLGEVAVTSCDEGLRFLQARTLSGAAAADSAAYPLAAQLLAAQLNLAAGAETCPAVEDAVRSAQLLLLGADFSGSGEALGSEATAEERDMAEFLTEQLIAYNAGNLCR